MIFTFAHGTNEEHEMEVAQAATQDPSGLVLFIGIICLLVAAVLTVRYFSTHKTSKK
jgi:hypothetical protein